MLNNLDFLKDGEQWPPKDEDEANRIAEHVLMRQVYNGLHDSIFPRYAAYLADTAERQHKPKIILDWAELATTTYLNLCFGKPIEIKSPMKQVPDRPDSQIVIDASRYGHAAYEVTGQGIFIINPENMYLVVSPVYLQHITHFVIFAKFKQKDQDGKVLEYIKFTIHSKGQIQHLVFELRGGKLNGPLVLNSFSEFEDIVIEENGIQKTKADDVLIVHVQNALSSERYYGRPDYKPSVLSLIESLEISFSERDEVQSNFTAPTPVVPDSAQVFDHGLGEWVYKPGEPIFTMPGDVQPSLMVWDAQLAHVEAAIEQKMDQLLQMLQLSRVLLAGKDAGTAESGTALRFRLIPTMSQVDKHARAMEKAIPKVLNLWSQLHPPVIEISNIGVILKDGLPVDQIETATAAQIWSSIGAISLERKLELQGFKEGSDAFNQELERIRGAQLKIAPAEPIIKLQPSQPVGGATG
jgi:hypothetical protein